MLTVIARSKRCQFLTSVLLLQVNEFYVALLGESKTLFSIIRDAFEPGRAANRVLTVPPINDVREAKALSIFHSHPESILSFRGPSFQISSPFHAAAASGCLELLKAISKHILENDLSRSEEERQRRLLKLVNKRALGVEGKTPLMLAAMLGKASCVTFLIEKGADCLAKEMLKGLTAIHLAIRHGHPGCIDAMLTAEPDVMGPFQPRTTPSQILNAPTTSGFAPLHHAVAFFQHECLDTLLKYSPQLNSRGAGVYSRELGMYCATGTTPLHVAALNNNLRAAFSILQHHMNNAALRSADGSAILDPRFAQDSRRLTAYQIARMLPATDPGLMELLALDSDLLGHFQIQLPTFGPPKLSVIAAVVLRRKLLADLQRVSDHHQAHHDTEAPAAPSSPSGRASASGIRVLASASAFISAPSFPSSNNTSPGVRNVSPIGCVPSVPRAEGVRPFQVRVSDPSTSIPPMEVAVAAKKDNNDILAASEALMAEMEGAGAKDKARAETPGASTLAVCFICFDAEPDVTISGCNHRVCGTCAKAMVEKAKASKILACPFCRKSVSGFEG
jgi:hypothetical protein